ADVVVAQGWEAGGHVWGEVATLPLVPCVVDAVRPTPVIAAGGIADGRGVAARETDTYYTTLFDGGWPDAPHRTLRNATVADWEAAGRPASGRRPGEGDVIATLPDGGPVARYSDVPPLPGMAGDLDRLVHYAGQSAGLVHRVQPAAEIVREIADETIRA